MTTEERNIVYAAAPPVEEAEAEQDSKDFPNSTFTIISKMAYLIGVPKRFFENEHSSPKIEVYQAMDRDKNARIVRNLCLLRTAIEQNYGKIYRAFQYDLKNLHTLPEYIPQDSIRQLSADGIEIIRANYKPIQYIIDLNNQIANRIKNDFCFRVSEIIRGKAYGTEYLNGRPYRKTNFAIDKEE